MIKKILFGCVFVLGLISSCYAFPDLVQIVPGTTYTGDLLIESVSVSNALTFSNPVKYDPNFSDHTTYENAFYWDSDGYLHLYINTTYGKSDILISGYNFVSSSGSTRVITQSQFINYVNNNLSSVSYVGFYFGYTCQSSYNNGSTFSIHFNDNSYIYFSAGNCAGNNVYTSVDGGPFNFAYTGTFAGLQTHNSPFNGSLNPSGDITNVYCPTVGQLIANYNNNGFSSGLCYSSSSIFNGSSFVSVDPVSIFDLFSSKEDFISSLNKFATYCESSVYNSSVCSQAFSGEDLRFNLISKIPQVTALGGRKSLYNYCELYSYDPNTTTCVGSGILAEMGSDFTNDDVIHTIVNGDFIVTSPDMSGTVFDNGSGYTFSGDIISNIQNIFYKFTSLFKKQTSNTVGILPLRILVPFLLIVLFRLFKK